MSQVMTQRHPSNRHHSGRRRRPNHLGRRQQTLPRFIGIYSPSPPISSLSSSSRTMTTSEPKTVSYPTRRARPWRRNITPTDILVDYPYPGKGTDAEPYLIKWIPNHEDGHLVDVENPQSWKSGSKWATTLIGAISVLAVTMVGRALSLSVGWTLGV